jgi:hypothetical protein
VLRLSRANSFCLGLSENPSEKTREKEKENAFAVMEPSYSLRTPPGKGGPSSEFQSIGFREPDDVSIEQAVQANDAFIAELERIRDASQALTLEHSEST